MTDYTVVGNDMHGAELRINDRVRIAHPKAGEKWRGKEAVIADFHEPHWANAVHAPAALGGWVRLDSDCVSPAGALEKVA